MKQHQHNQQGFSLIELVIYIGVLSVVLIVVSLSSVSLNRARLRVESKNEVHSAIRFGYDKISQDLQSAQIISSPAALGTSSEDLEMSMSGNVIRYCIPDGILRRQVNGTVCDNTSSAITSSKVIISNPSFTLYANTNSVNFKTFASIKFSYTAAYNATGPDFQYTEEGAPAVVDVKNMNAVSGDGMLVYGENDPTRDYQQAVWRTSPATLSGALSSSVPAVDNAQHVLIKSSQKRQEMIMGIQDGPMFFDQVTYTAGTATANVVSSDLNEDGKQDLAITNITSGNVSVLLGNGNGTFGTAVNYTTATNPRGLAVVDLNADGHLDFAITNFGSASVSVLSGNGDGTFDTAINYSVGTQPINVVASDFDNDGDIDLATSNYGSANMSVLLNFGDGSFNPTVNYGAGTNPRNITGGDFDGDSDTDLAVANYGTANVSVFLGSGSGTFAAKVDYGAGTNPMGIANADLDKDGDMDLVVTNSGSANVSVLLGSGTGTFGSAANYGAGTTPSFVAVSDMNEDGSNDLVVTNYGSATVSVLLATGAGVFAAKTDYGASTNPYSVAVADFNGDGKQDVVATNSGSSVASVFIGNGNSTGRLTIYKSVDSGFSWTSQWSAFVGDAVTARFAIGYEQTSGDAVVFYSGNSAPTNVIRYRVWNGDFWAAAESYTSAGAPAVVQGIQVAERPNSDELAVAWISTDNDMNATTWNGSSLVLADEPAAVFSSNVARGTQAQPISGGYQRSFGIAYESLSGDLMVVFGENAGTSLSYVIRSGGSWGAVQTVSLGGAEATLISLSPSPISNKLAVSIAADASATSGFGLWDGSSWTQTASDATSLQVTVAGETGSSVAWLIDGNNEVAIYQYRDQGSDGIDWYSSTNGGAITSQTDFSTSPTPGNERASVLTTNPINTKEAILAVEDNNADLFVKRVSLVTTTVTWANQEPSSAAIETNVPYAFGIPFGFAFQRFNP